MKKLFALLTIATALTACNNDSDVKTEAVKDSVTEAESPLMDAINTADSANKVIEAVKDSTGKY